MFDDFTWENVAPSCWSIIELTSAITCSCLPTLRPIMTRYFPKLGTIGRSTKGYAQTGESGPSGAPPTVGSQSMHRQNRGLNSSGDFRAAGSQIELKGGRKTSADYEASVGDASSAESLAREQIVSLGPTVRTNIRPSSPGGLQPVEGDQSVGVTVQREVYLTTSRKY